MFAPELIAKAQTFLQSCKARGMTLATAESCTGGLLSALLTEISGSSNVFTHGFITYANEAKQAQLAVSAADLKRYGAVSEQVAIAMARGARAVADTALAVSITGIAGPGGGSAEKPVGLVYVASVRDGFGMLCERRMFSGTRSEVRLQAVVVALEMVERQLCR